jgi:mannitol-1-phosphate/altronate dehydrogenase
MVYRSAPNGAPEVFALLFGMGAMPTSLTRQKLQNLWWIGQPTGVIGVELRETSRQTHNLHPYLLAQIGGTKSFSRAEEIRGLDGVVQAWKDPNAIAAVAQRRDVIAAFVSLGINAYHLVGNELIDFQNAEIQHDLALQPGQCPKTIYGALLNLIDARSNSKAATTPFTIYLLENGLPSNARDLLPQFILASNRPHLLESFQRYFVVLLGMFDRVAPTHSADKLQSLADQFRYDGDAVGVEFFSLLVVEEDPFHNLHWDESVRVVSRAALAAWLATKARYFNSAHFCVALMVGAADGGYIHDALTVPHAQAVVTNLHSFFALKEAPVDQAYVDGMYSRMMNDFLEDPVQRVARNSADKMAKLVAIALKWTEQEQPPTVLIHLFALWILELDAAFLSNSNFFASLKPVQTATLTWLATSRKMVELRDLVANISSITNFTPFVEFSRDNELMLGLAQALVNINTLGIEAAFEMALSPNS